eukprot:1144519-Pelagomonas_calceolata.AAC.1
MPSEAAALATHWIKLLLMPSEAAALATYWIELLLVPSEAAALDRIAPHANICKIVLPIHAHTQGAQERHRFSIVTASSTHAHTHTLDPTNPKKTRSISYKGGAAGQGVGNPNSVVFHKQLMCCGLYHGQLVHKEIELLMELKVPSAHCSIRGDTLSLWKNTVSISAQKAQESANPGAIHTLESIYGKN